MSLDPANGAILTQAAVDAQIQRGIDGDPLLSPTDIAKELAQAYLDYSKGGTLPGADLTVGGTKALLDTAFISDNTAATIDSLAAGVCNYWSTNNANGVPAHGGSVVISVVINGASMIAAMKAVIQALVNNPSSNGWVTFYEDTEAIVNAIPCVVTELVGSTPTPFPEAIS